MIPIGGFDRPMIEWDYLGESMIVIVGEAIPDDRAGVTVAAAVLIFAPIFLIACYHGLAVQRSPSEVPVATSRASLTAFLYLVLLHGLVSMSVLMQSAAGPLVRGLL